MNPSESHSQVFTYDNFQLIIEHAPIGIVIIDKDYKWLLTNKRFSEITGYNKQELQNLTFLDITHKDDIELNLNLYSQLTSGRVDEYKYEKRYIRKDGRIIWVHLTVNGVRFGGEYAYMIALIQDIDENKNYRNNLEIRNKELDTLFYKASHDLKSPISTIQGLVNLLKIQPPNVHHELINHLHETVNKLNDQNLTLLQLASLNEIPVTYEPVSITNIIKGLKEELHLNIHISVKTESDAIVCDRILLRTIFKNLLDNALRYTEGEPAIEITHSQTEGKYQILVRDYGTGIKDDIQNRVFDMFFKGSSKSTGSGLGLYLTRKAVEKLGGEIKVVTPAGKGSQFEIVIPIPENIK